MQIRTKTGEAKFGKVRFADFTHLDADFSSGAVSVRRALSQTLAASIRASVERSRAAEAPYSYDG